MHIRRREFLKFSAAALGASLLPAPVTAEVHNDMPYRALGKTGEKVSLLCIGGYHIGQGSLSDEEAITLMRTAVDEGVNFFDNAWQYNAGASEVRMGKALKDGYREKVFLMTKHKGRTRADAQRYLEDSLRRLDVDVIDLWQCHELIKPDEPRAIHENGVIEFALEAKKQGKVRYLGFTGHFTPSTHTEMLARGFAWDTVQMPLNVFDHHFRSFEREVLPKAVERNMGIIAMKTLGGTPGRIVQSKAATVAECLRYAMNLPVSSVCSGIDSMEKLKENLAVAKAFKPFDPTELAALLQRTREKAATGEFEDYKTAWHRG